MQFHYINYVILSKIIGKFVINYFSAKNKW